MAASAPVSRRYVSAVYEDKYFPEKNAAIPFKWETSPGTPKYDGGKDDNDECPARYASIQQDNEQCLQELARIRTHAANACTMPICPLRPPPAWPLHVKEHGSVRQRALSDDPFDDEVRCPLHVVDAYHHGSLISGLSVHFRSRKARTVVPICRNHCVVKRSPHQRGDKCQASSLLTHAPFQGRSQSFNDSAMHHVVAAKCAANGSTVAWRRDASLQAPGRRCNSFNLNSAQRSGIHHENEAQDDDDFDDVTTSSMAAATVWAGACILAAAAARNVVPTDHHQHFPCMVAMKLRELMQQSANFSELELPMMIKLKKGGDSMIKESFSQCQLCRETKTKSLDKEATEAFLREGMKNPCTHIYDDDYIGEGEPTKEKATHEGDDQPDIKLVKRKSFLKVFMNECIACWCPTPNSTL